MKFVSLMFITMTVIYDLLFSSTENIIKAVFIYQIVLIINYNIVIFSKYVVLYSAIHNIVWYQQPVEPPTIATSF